MVDVIVYKPPPYGIVLIHDKPLGLRPRVYIIYHIKYARVYVSYNYLTQMSVWQFSLLVVYSLYLNQWNKLNLTKC